MITRFRTLLAASLLASLAPLSQGGVAYQLFFGSLLDAGASPLANSTVVVLVANTGGGALPGGLDGTDITINGLDSGTAFADFQGVQLSVGQTTNSGDQVFYVGQIDGFFGAGTLNDASTLGYPASYPPGLASGQDFGIYWFPGVTTPGATLPTVPFEMGGFFNPNPNTSFSDIGMTLQSDTSGALHTVYQIDSATAAGFGETSAITAAAFSAIEVAPSLNNFANWIAGFPAVGGENGFEDDPDGDGLDNGTESALGTRPDTANLGVTVLSSAGGLTAQSSQAKPSLADVTATWQWSDNLTDWYISGESNGSETVAIDESVTDPSDPDFDVTEVDAEVTIGQLDRLFLRLSVTQTP